MFIVNNNNLTTLHVHHAILYISLPSLHDLDMKRPNFTRPLYEEVEHDTKIFYLILDTVFSDSTPENFTNIWQIKMKINKIDEFWNSAISLFKWRFRFVVIQKCCYHGNMT